MDGFWTIAAAEPSRVLLVDADGTEVTAGDLLAASNQLTYGMRALGIGRGDAIAIAMRNGRAFVELVMAALQTGVYLVPLNAKLVVPEIAYVLKNADARALFCDDATADTCAEAARAISFADDRCFATTPRASFRSYASLKDGQPTTTPNERSAGSVMFYTSGTTGQPKAVRRPLSTEPPERASALTARLRLGSVGISTRAHAPSVHLAVSPLVHSAALAWATAHLHVGHAVVLMDDWSAEGVLAKIERHRVTSTLVVPTHFRRLLALPDDVRARYDVSSLRHVVHGGAPCPVDVKKRMMEWWGPVIHEVYGAAEASVGTHVGPEEWLAHPGTVGKANAQIKILTEEGAECRTGEIGLVYFASGGQSFEYLRDPSKTADARRGELFTVGDVGFVDDAGYLFLCDRKSDVIISGGVNVYPAEIERVLEGHSKVADVAVIGVPDEEWGEQVKAIVEPAAGVVGDADLARELAAYCKSMLASFKCPRSFDFATSLPRGANGKLYKRTLRDPYWAGRARKI